ncbi:MAG TPA: hypothetical protein VF545_03085 [Thermoleophilaceae bacterium]|jgi:hypothetical protein
MRFFLAVAVTSVLALVAAGTASAQTLSPGHANGHGSVAEDTGNSFTPYKFSFNAQGVTVGGDVAPAGGVRFSNPGGSFRGSVDCYFQADNEAFFSGHVESSHGDLVPEALQGQIATYSAHVVDNGEGSDSPPDTIGFTAIMGPFSLDCFSAALLADTVATGQVQVHPVD